VKEVKDNKDPKWAQFVAYLWSHKETLAEAVIVIYLALRQFGVL